MIKEIKSGNTILARYISSDAWKEGLNFFSNENEFLQVGTWRYNSGKVLLPHVHNEVKREILRTQEVLYIKKGSIKASIYDLKNNLVEEIVVKEGDILILLQGGHGYIVLEDDTQVLEIKNGPYLGAEIDRRRI